MHKACDTWWIVIVILRLIVASLDVCRTWVLIFGAIMMLTPLLPTFRHFR